ncbi:hypothetical protein PUNSTDRAFT_134951 [Punctularia strigosozonata HHB-11173 SS5]|uniref:uncharacterized protein n=1 Tax=Punctularia strigosozonata (strain HHB-11173) TaxID=741275 RepID=UPI0004417D04|nr:uncharacterized protein PUNSTDRAFT_134951 [Punctularia strigosozonata HHB-11173 SS5]EIN08578.1 hypothetical protein PUNSTDRAFT_134951 [Punctularia strigosozonata HHB-11173 SS5]
MGADLSPVKKRTSDCMKHLHELLTPLHQSRQDMFSVRIEHNASRPVSRLPFELLQAIFILSHDSPTSSSIVSWQGADHRPQFHWPSALAQVCGIWRQVALNTSTLWTSLEVWAFPTLAFHISEIFPEEPLRIFHYGFDLFGDESLRTLSAIIAKDRARIVELGIYLMGHSHISMDVILDMFQGYAPLLQRLVVDTAGGLALHSRDELVRIETRLSNIHAPALSNLKLRCLASPTVWKSKLIRSSALSHLSIEHIHTVHRIPKPTLHEILIALEHIPSLQVLQLAHCLEHEMGGVISRRQPNMWCLRELEIRDSCCGCTNIFRNLTLAQPLTRLALSCTSSRCPRCPELAAELWQLAENGCDLPGELEMEIDWANSYQLVIRCRHDALVTKIRDPFYIEMQDQTEYDVWNTVCHLGPVLPSGRITKLTLWGVRPWSHPHSSFRDVLRRWTSIRNISVHCRGAAISLLQAFRAPESSMPELDRLNWVLPSLSALTICDVWNSSHQSVDGSWLDICHDEVERRRRAKGEDSEPTFRFLSIQRCAGISQEALAALEKIVPCLHVAHGGEYVCDPEDEYM